MSEYRGPLVPRSRRDRIAGALIALVSMIIIGLLVGWPLRTLWLRLIG